MGLRPEGLSPSSRGRADIVLHLSEASYSRQGDRLSCFIYLFFRFLMEFFSRLKELPSLGLLALKRLESWPITRLLLANVFFPGSEVVLLLAPDYRRCVSRRGRPPALATGPSYAHGDGGDFGYLDGWVGFGF